jgi:1-acyl-sn-glycerol-3-phosphate acyltransferase
VLGRERLSKESSAYIFASNHTSDLDSVLLRVFLGIFSRFGPLITVARSHRDYQWKGWRRFVYSNLLFQAIGAYPVHSGLHDYRKSLDFFVRAGISNQSILIFIGGRQQHTLAPIKRRGGTSFLAWATGLPVVPVSIVGTVQLSWFDIFFKRKKIVIEYGEPILKESLFTNEDPGVDDFKKASGVIVDKIEEKLLQHSVHY